MSTTEADAVSKWMKGDKEGAVELLKAWVNQPPDHTAPLGEQIMRAQLTGDFPGAVQLAMQWMEEIGRASCRERV
jgi:hypothetical protein